MIMDLRLGTRILVATTGRAEAKGMQITGAQQLVVKLTILAGIKEVEVRRAGVR